MQMLFSLFQSYFFLLGCGQSSCNNNNMFLVLSTNIWFTQGFFLLLCDKKEYVYLTVEGPILEANSDLSDAALLIGYTYLSIVIIWVYWDI